MEVFSAPDDRIIFFCLLYWIESGNLIVRWKSPIKSISTITPPELPQLRIYQTELTCILEEYLKDCFLIKLFIHTVYYLTMQVMVAISVFYLSGTWFCGFTLYPISPGFGKCWLCPPTPSMHCFSYILHRRFDFFWTYSANVCL